MRILITGNAGFIGFHLANLLAENGHSVYGIDSVNDYYDPILKLDRLRFSGFNIDNVLSESESYRSSKFPDYQFRKILLEDKEKVYSVFSEFQPEIVVNLAAQAGVRYSLTNPEAYINANITGFLNILEACRKYPVQQLLYASSSSVYGLNKKMPFSVQDNVDHPVSLYAASKKSNELMAHTYSHLFGVPTTGLRFFTVYGPWGRPDMALFIFTKAILKGEAIEVFNHGKMERDFTYVDDIVSGISKMIEKTEYNVNLWNPENPDPSFSSAPYKLYNIGNNSPVKLLDFIKSIEKATGKKAIMHMKDIQPGDVEKTWANVDSLISEFDYKPNTPVSIGIKSFVNWFREYYKI
ncbi:MAG: NAD-dependent epimerase [Bacteroidales bacterium]|nr:NAD-dependent epimerase [Bacteroidales bacterium]